MNPHPELMTPREAAQSLGISYPTLKHWILSGKIRTVKTPGGHHRIPVGELDEYLPRRRKTGKNATIRMVSGRNQLVGRVAEIKVDGLLAKVVISLGEQRVTAIITADAVADLGLKKGDIAVALIKSTEVMIARP
jgi:molybdopterin-binding protein